MNIGTTTTTMAALAASSLLVVSMAVAMATPEGSLAAPVTTAPPADASPSYDDPANWLCRPDLEDPCDGDLDATVVAADGTLSPDPFTPDADAPVDCFYVYPTISRDEAPISDLTPSPGEEWYVARNQVAPLGPHCRVFAPVYRQITLSGLTAVLSGDPVDADAGLVGYGDVVAAWNHYLAHDNDGRGVVLVGHSQGSSVLTRLLASEIDPDPAVRDLIVAAYLGGTSFQVPRGRDVGGSLQHMPLCHADDDIGCIVTWSSFRSTDPAPADSLFGAPSGDTVAACTNPAALSGGSADLAARFPSDADASILADLGTDAGGATWVDPAVGTVDTPFAEVPGLVSGRCVSWSDRNWLEVTVQGDPGDPRADDIPGDLAPPWGLHLVDMNLVMGDLQHLVASQGAAWAAAH